MLVSGRVVSIDFPVQHWNNIPWAVFLFQLFFGFHLVTFLKFNEWFTQKWWFPKRISYSYWCHFHVNHVNLWEGTINHWSFSLTQRQTHNQPFLGLVPSLGTPWHVLGDTDGGGDGWNDWGGAVLWSCHREDEAQKTAKVDQRVLKVQF